MDLGNSHREQEHYSDHQCIFSPSIHYYHRNIVVERKTNFEELQADPGRLMLIPGRKSIELSSLSSLISGS